MNSHQGFCFICNHQFSYGSRKFYCCDPNKKYCILCKYRYICDTCNKSIIKESAIPKCSECYHSTASETDYYSHQQCNKYICAKCLLNRRKRSINQEQVTLQCGHKEEMYKIHSFLNRFCRFCGTKCDSILDYELLNGEKCCFSCFKYHQKEIYEEIIRCMSCDVSIRQLKEAGASSNDFILCKNCVAFSKIEEKNIMDHNQQMKKSYLQDENIKQEAKDNKATSNKSAQKKTETQIKKQNLSIQQIESQIIVQPGSSVLKNPSNEGSQQKKIERQITVCSKKTDLTESNENKGIRNLKKTILNKFPSQEMIDLKQTKMKKHLSMETFVEAMKISVEPQKEHLLQCSQCDYLTTKNEMYEISDDKNDKKMYCRLCYTFLKKNQLLSFNNLNRYQSTLMDSRNRRGGSSQKPLFNPIKSSHHTTDKKQQQIKNESKDNNLLRPQPNKLTGKLSGTYQRFRTSNLPENRTSYQRSQTQCSICKCKGQSCIKTVKNGNVCFKCYYKARQVK